jgi:hypothetical protein
MANIYWPQIKTILEPGLACMKRRTVGTDEGTFRVELDDYATVKRLHKIIAAALNAWERDANGQWKRDGDGQAIQTEDNAMRPLPAGGPLPVEDVDAFLTWIDDGMLEGPPVA